MNNTRTSPEKDACAAGTALQAHCLRVDVLAVELARRLRWDDSRQKALSESAKSHHVCFPDPLLLKRLISGVWGKSEKVPAGVPTEEAREMARLLELSCFFVERWEYSHFEPVSFDQVVEEMSWLAADGFFEDSHVLALARVPGASFSQLQQIIHRLPVFPGVALQAMRIAADPYASAARLEEIVASDMVLAGEILGAANSASYSPVSPIRSIRQAALFIGLPACCRVLAAAALRPLFGGAYAEALWKHSLEIARLAESIARLSGRAAPEDAFLAGLLHDAGRLALTGLPHHLVARYNQSLEDGVESVFAELLLCGFDHTTLGAEILRHWLVPAEFIDAVEHHHQPERSSTPLASILFLAEYWSASEENLPSLARLRFSLEKLGLRSEDTFLLNAQSVAGLAAMRS